MTSEPLACVLRLVPETRQRLLAEGTQSSAIDTIYAGDTWMSACIAAISEAPDWLAQQVGEHEDDALIPDLIADSKGPQARAAFLAQSTAAAAAGAWASGDKVACVEAARRAARWWAAVDGLDYRDPATPPTPLATLNGSLQAERAEHDPRVWAPVEEMVLHADPATDKRPATLRAEVLTWVEEPGGVKPAKFVLEAVAAGQPGLWRAPQAGLTATDAPFQAALRDAWAWATAQEGLDPDISVRWRLLLHPDESRASRGNGDAIGLACAVSLQQLAVRHQRLHRLDRHTSYLAAVAADGTVMVPTCQVSPESRARLRRLVVASKQPAPPARLALRHADVVNDAVAHGRQPVQARHFRRMAAAGVLATVVLIAGLAVARSGQSDSRNRAAASAHARQAEAATLASDAQAALSADPPRAIAAAAAAYRLAPHSPAVIDAVIAAAASDPRALHYLSPAAAVTQLSLSRDGKLLAALLGDGRIEVWSLAAKTPQVLPVRQPPGRTSAISFVGGSPTLAAAGTAVTVLDPVTGAIRHLGTGGSGISDISASSHSRTFVTASAAGIRLWDSATGTSRTLSQTPAADVSLAPNGQTVLVGENSGTLQLLRTAGGVAASTRLPSPATSVLLGQSGGAYAVTRAGELYGFATSLRRVSSIAIPPDTTLTLRPGARLSELTPDGLLKVRSPAQVVAAASNAAILLPDEPAQITAGSGSDRTFNAVGIPIRGMSLPSLATDGDGRLAATVLADGQIRISTIDLASGPPVQVEDVASAAIVNRSTLAVTSGLLYVRAFTALVNSTTGQVTSLERFSHATDVFQRPVTTPRDVVATGMTTSSLDVWRIHEDRLTTVARNLSVASSPISGIAVDDDTSLLFVAADTHLYVRRLTSPALQLTRTSTSGRIACLTADPARHTLYACTSHGVMAFSYTTSGQLRDPRIVGTASAQGVAVSPDGEIMITLDDGDAVLLPRGSGPQGGPGLTLTTDDTYTLSAVLTPTAAIISGRNSELLLYSSATGAQILDTQLGGTGFVTALWQDHSGIVGGATLDGSLFTLPPTSPAPAVHDSCALLADPSAQWRTDFGGTPAAAQLPAAGGC
ncbi:MAG: WD40 repeat domain-containing protein [Streptosporangiaceae bacterium]